MAEDSLRAKTLKIVDKIEMAKSELGLMITKTETREQADVIFTTMNAHLEEKLAKQIWEFYVEWDKCKWREG